MDEPRPKRIVICCDGTWNTPDQPVPSNVVQMARSVAPQAQDGTTQVVFYDQGVGTTGNILDSVLGGAFGQGLEKNILDAYRFLIHNYVEDDELFIFGFSRGAYTARSLVGLLRNCGLLHKRDADLVPDAFTLYRRKNAGPNSREAEEFRAAHAHEVGVKFLGVWDTVGALGLPVRGLRHLAARRHEFHDVELSSIVHHAYHALAIDERRFAFRASLWKEKPKADQVVEQVWFPGVHADVGGGYPERGLGNVTFTWMASKAVACGLELDHAYITETLTPVDPLDALHNSRVSFYRLSWPHTRRIGVDGGRTEAVHPGTLARLNLTEFREEAGGYAPANISTYVGRADHRVAQ